MIIWTWIILFYHYFPFLFRRNALTFFKNLGRKRSGDPRRILPEVFRRPASAEGQAVNPFGRSGACPFSPMACLFDDSNPPVKQGQKRGICPGELRPPPPETSCRFRIRKTFGTVAAAGAPFPSSSPLPLEEAFSRTRRRQRHFLFLKRIPVLTFANHVPIASGTPSPQPLIMDGPFLQTPTGRASFSRELRTGPFGKTHSSWILHHLFMGVPKRDRLNRIGSALSPHRGSIA